MSQTPSAAALDYDSPPRTQQNIARLTFYFGLVYFCQGVSQIVLLINQPLRRYLREVHGFGPEQLGNFLFIAMLPWVLKPLYGLISDFIPLLGYRRKSYLLLLNLSVAVAFLWVTGVTRPEVLVVAMFITGLGVAASDVIVDALMVETGQATGRVKLFQGVQWLCINIAGVGSGLAAMWITRKFSARAGLQIAAVICASLPFVVAVMTWWAVKEERSRLDTAQLRATAGGLWAALTSLRLWLVLAFLILGTFRPAMVTPMYDHVMKRLGVEESFNSLLDTLQSLGMALGAALFMGVLSKRFSTHMLIVIGLVAAALSMVPYFFITSKAVAYAASLVYGVGYILASLASLSLAAEACPKRAEGTVFAAMMAISNLGLNYGDKLGSQLYEGYYKFNVHPLVGISIAFTLAGLLLIPFLPARPVDAPADTAGFPVLPPGHTAPPRAE